MYAVDMTLENKVRETLAQVDAAGKAVWGNTPRCISVKWAVSSPSDRTPPVEIPSTRMEEFPCGPVYMGMSKRENAYDQACHEGFHASWQVLRKEEISRGFACAVPVRTCYSEECDLWHDPFDDDRYSWER